MSASRKALSVAEFLAWEEAQPDRFEFDGVQPVAMTGGSVAHARIVRRLLGALEGRLPAGCEAFAGDLKVVTAQRVRYPDASIVCGPLAPTADRIAPRVVFEVLSPSTALTDRRVKPDDYAAVETVLAYVMLDQDQPRATILRRATGWREQTVAGAEAVLDLEDVALRLPLASLYAPDLQR